MTARLPLALVLGVIVLSAGTSAGEQLAPSAFGNPADAPFVVRPAPVAKDGGAPRAEILNLDTGATFASLQEAVDDSATLDGHTLVVQYEDHLEGTVLLHKSVTVAGATGLEQLNAAVDTGDAGDARAWLLVDDSSQVAFRNLGFNGNGHQVWQAVRVKAGSQATFDRCTFRNVRHGSYQGTGIAAMGSVAVVDSAFTGMGRIGALVFGDGVVGDFDGVTYAGKGSCTCLDYGVEAGGGAAVTVVRSRLVNCRGLASDGSASAGVLATTAFGPGTTATLVGNTLADNRIGLAIGADAADTTVATAAFNRIATNLTGSQAKGASSVMAENNWWGCNAGPLAAPPCDEVVGAGDQDFDPWLVLRHVADPPAVEPLDSAQLLASLTWNSDGVDTFAAVNIPDGTRAAFSAVQGTVAPVHAFTLDGVATADYTAPASATTDTATVAVDKQLADVEIPVSPYLLSVAPLEQTAREGLDTAVTVQIRLSSPAGAAGASVQYATVDGSAWAGQDFGAVSGTATFAPGATATTVEVPILDDVALEGNEQFTLVLWDPVNSAIVHGTATVVVDDNEDGTVPGDTNLDWVYDAADLAGLVWGLNGYATPGSADCNEDGEVDRADVRCMLLDIFGRTWFSAFQLKVL